MILRDHLLLGMPFQTTTLLPLTESVSPVPDSLTSSTTEPALLHSRADRRDRLGPPSSPPSPPSPPASAASDAPALTSSLTKSDPTPPPPSSRSANHARRYTLTRFPLLRKGSRELSRTPSTTASPAHSPFYPTGAPRASQSIARGPDTCAARQSPTSPHQEATVTAQDAPDTRPRVAERPGEGKPDKMHQTSSRLLRMTDDERPFTRVSTPVFFSISSQYCRAAKSPTFFMTCSHPPGTAQGPSNPTWPLPPPALLCCLPPTCTASLMA